MKESERTLAFVPTPEILDEVRTLPADSLPRFSVVIPSFNQAQFLFETLESVFAQGYPRFDVFVADGGSTDGSRSILEDYAARHPGIFRFVSEPDGGQEHAVNKGISATHGDVVAWINSDDVYLPGAFWKVAAFFHFNRCALVAYGRNRYTDERLRPVVDYPVDWSPRLREQRRRMWHFCLPPQPSLFFRRRAVDLGGALASDILDYELWLRWQRDLPFFFIDDHLSLSRLHAEAKTVRTHRQLIIGVCDVVHRNYRLVPYSWALKLALEDEYKDAWTRGEPTPVTRAVRRVAWMHWVRLNLRWAPRALAGVAGDALAAFRESLRDGLDADG